MEALELEPTISQTTQDLFDLSVDLPQSESSFCDGILSGMNFEASLEEIRCLTEAITLIKEIPFRISNVEPGTVFVHDVNVGVKNENKLHVYPKVSIKIISMVFS